MWQGKATRTCQSPMSPSRTCLRVAFALVPTAPIKNNVVVFIFRSGSCFTAPGGKRAWSIHTESVKAIRGPTR